MVEQGRVFQQLRSRSDSVKVPRHPKWCIFLQMFNASFPGTVCVHEPVDSLSFAPQKFDKSEL